MDTEGKGELHIADLKLINEQLRYGYNEDQLWDIIHAVGGYNADTISFDKFNTYIKRVVSKRKLLWYDVANLYNFIESTV